MSVFRGKLRDELLRALRRGELTLPPGTSEAELRSLLNKLGRLAWNVKILERYEHGQGVATYLARYLKGGPISNGRLLSLRCGRVFSAAAPPTAASQAVADRLRSRLRLVVRGRSNYPLKLTVLPDWSRDRSLPSLAFPRPIRYPRRSARQLNYFVIWPIGRAFALIVNTP